MLTSLERGYWMAPWRGETGCQLNKAYKFNQTCTIACKKGWLSLPEHRKDYTYKCIYDHAAQRYTWVVPKLTCEERVYTSVVRICACLI
jgi:hypothetical protein